MRNGVEIVADRTFHSDRCETSEKASAGLRSRWQPKALLGIGLAIGLLFFVQSARAQKPGAQLLYRINCGGPELAGTTEFPQLWAEDSETNPSPYSNHAVTSTTDRTQYPRRDAALPDYVPTDVFRHERYGLMQWDLPLPAGLQVEVNLFLAETYSGITGAGQRVFDVTLEGQLALDNLDLYAEHGPNICVMKSFSATVGPDGKLDIDFGQVSGDPLLNGLEVFTFCNVSTPSWQNTSIYPQTSWFEVEYEATPLGSNIDGIVGLSQQAGSTYGDFAALIRFNNAGKIDARDGSVYRAQSVIAYTPGIHYRFRMKVDVSTRRYDVYVTVPPGSETTLAHNFAFRTEQSGVTSLGNWALQCGSGAFEVCDFMVRPYVRNTRTGLFYPTIQAAIDEASGGDEIVLPPGRYIGEGNRDIEGRDKSLTIRGSDPEDPALVAATVLDAQGDAHDRHRAFNLRSYVPCTVTIAGLTMINGYAPHEDIDGYSDSAGGAVFCDGVSLILEHCVLKDNTAQNELDPVSYSSQAYGGAVCCIAPRLVVQDCTLSSNSARLPLFAVSGDTYGGAVYADCTDAITITGSVITGNIAAGAGVSRTGVGNGGGLYCNGSATLSGCTISNNIAGWSEWRSRGGGVLSLGSLIMRDCTIVENTAYPGNDISSLGGGVCCLGSADLSHCLVARNGTAAIGGGVYCASGHPSRITHSTFMDNLGGGTYSEQWVGGGAIYGADLVQNCLIMGNSANFHGGGLHACGDVVGCVLLGNDAMYEGAVSGGLLQHCTVVGNWSLYEGALGTSLVRNCVVWGNQTRGAATQLLPFVSAQYSCIQDWTGGGPGNTNLSPKLEILDNGAWTGDAAKQAPYDPITTFTDSGRSWAPGALKGLLVNPDTVQQFHFYILDNDATTITVLGDAPFALTGAAYTIHGYHLRAGSPCIDTGDPSLDYTGQSDIDGEPRVQGYRADIGADESGSYFPLAPPANVAATPSTVCIGGCLRLSATPGEGGDSVQWFADDCGGTLLSAGEVDNSCPARDTVYYARTHDSLTGQVSACLPVAVNVGGEWQAPADGIDGDVNQLMVHQARLIVTGDFQHAGDVPTAHIAAWDGSQWEALGGGLDGWARSLGSYDADLVVGGWFTHAGTVEANHVARWDGTAWHALGSGTDSVVRAFAEHQGGLIVGGNFTSAGGTPDTAYIARWNGSAWQSMGGGMDSHVYVLTAYNDDIVAGGDFTTAGEAAANHIAVWDGTHWLSLGQGLDGYVMAFAQYQDKLIAAGSFATASGVTCNNIAQWNGFAWQSLGEGTDGSINALAVHRDQLIAAGSFTRAGGVAAAGIARWDGTEWLPLTAGMNNTVQTLTTFQNQLFAGGSFTSAGGKSANHIAGLDCCAPPLVWANPVSQTLDAGQEAVLTVAATGNPPLTWRWRKDGADLLDDGRIRGTQTTTLTIARVGMGDAGSYDVIVTDTCGAATSTPAILTVTCPAAAAAADLDADCDIDGDDLSILVDCGSGPHVPYDPAALPTGCSLLPDGSNRIAADLDTDGDIDSEDFSSLQRCLSGPGRVPEPSCAEPG